MDSTAIKQRIKVHKALAAEAAKENTPDKTDAVAAYKEGFHKGYAAALQDVLRGARGV